ncbi:uncharacterized protein RJT20DRAFT_126968 [Scheffersomyces xylosifermentans]|uniref:uncharacterized protein n=1 Tax=Scheffersomyces xylosifermentans TaxID=1304137 RepID=UPI00315C9E8A
MSTNGQFPPSSPLISNDDYATADPFSFKSKDITAKHSGGKHHEEHEERGRFDYPTPNPSSALFRSSSPAPAIVNGESPESEDELEQETNIKSLKVSKAPKSIKTKYSVTTPDRVSNKTKKSVKFDLKKNAKKVNINKDFNILHPDAKVSRIPLIESKSHLTIGRSSNSCDFALSSKDSFISRTHMSISYNSEQIILTCLGVNGVAIRIPKSCYVYATTAESNFIVVENTTGKPLDLKTLNLQESHRSIVLDPNHTEFFIRKNETITMPRFSNVLLEISEHIMLLNPVDIEEELTEDELPVLIGQETTLITPLKAPIKNFPTPKTPVKVLSEEQLKSNEVTPSKPPATGIQAELEKPKPPKLKTEQTPKPKQTPVQAPIEIAQPKPSTSFKIFEDLSKEGSIISPSVSPQPIKRQSTPLNDKSNTFSNPSTPNTKRAQSEEPQKQVKKKKKASAVEMVAINQEWIANIDNVEEINNILINHLAFSRLSSTPASFLNTISVLTSKLELRQIRVLLYNIKCIGVIYREGKDAAGKPLEEEYYYIPESDDDVNRTELVSNVKGHGGLRSCRRTHKQYYWKKPAPIKK